MTEQQAPAASEKDTILASNSPNTVESLQHDLSKLGLEAGHVVIVHSSLSALGWVAGGAQAVVEALCRTVGDGGTIVMPAHSGQLSDPAAWSDPPVPAYWVPELREHLPAFDPDLTATRGMGQIVETFRSDRRSVRSRHPLLSFVALGPRAEQIVDGHLLTSGLGEESPLARLYDNDARVLLLGVGHGNNTSLHLAEYRADWSRKTEVRHGAPTMDDGTRRWSWFEDLDHDESDFVEIGKAIEAAGLQHRGLVGSADALLMSQRAVVDLATSWIAEHR